MEKAYLKRIKQADYTLGQLTCGQFACFTLELPDRDNEKFVSCIPNGLYMVRRNHSHTFGKGFIVKGVVGRTGILIHKGNYTKDTKGCILPGEYIKDINGDKLPDVARSGATMERMLEELPAEFILEISG